MTQEDAARAAAEFLDSFDEGRYPADFLRDYEPIACLGANAWGETLLVENRAARTPAVAKCSPADQPGSGSEPDLLRRLENPHLPVLLADYRDERTVCTVREYFPGVTLAEAAQERDFTKDEIVDIGIQLSETLRYLHALTPPIIHRDIKPENIILGDDGQIALIDFGISRTFDKDARGDTQNLGTRSFAPPEQYGFAQTDCRSDIFSMGMVLGFLLTKSTELAVVQKGIADPALARIVNTCTAFAPKDRYRSAEQVRRALLAQQPRARWRRRILLGVAGAALLAALGFGLPAVRAAASPPTPVFAEPLLEQAVRAALGRTDAGPLSEQELASVEELYVFAGRAVQKQEDFYAAANDWYAAGMQGRGDIASLADVGLLPNLRVLCVAAQRVSDLSPLAQLTALEKVEFKHNRITDIDVLAALPALASVGLNDNPIADAAPLGRCKGLRFLHLCDVAGYDPAFLSSLGDFEFLDLANRTDSYQYLGARRVRELKLGYTALDSLSWLSGVSGLVSLEVKHSALTKLDGVEAHAELTCLNLAGCAIGDLSPVLSLPKLQTLILSEDMRPAAESLGEPPFEIRYE